MRKPARAALLAILKPMLSRAWRNPKARASLQRGFKRRFGVDIKNLEELLAFIMDHLDDFAAIFEFVMSLISKFI